MRFKKTLSLLFATFIISSALSGCTNKSNDSNILYLYNWGDYLDPDIKTQFEEETGIKVVEDVYETNEIMYQKINNGSSKYDLIIPSEYMIQKMSREGLLEEINYDNIPNFEYIGDNYKNLPYDANNTFSVPYMWGTVGIMYNTTLVDEDDVIDSWNVLWDPKYKNEILMPDSVRESMMAALIKLGYSQNTTNLDQIALAKEELIKQKQQDLVRAYVVDEVKDAMIGGEAAIAVVWSGDAVIMQDENEDLEYVLPKEGTNKWFDGLAIPKGAPHKENAEKFINFLCRPDIAAQNADYIGYSTPNDAAYELLDEEIQNNPTAYPDEDYLDNKCDVFVDLGIIITNAYYDAWLEVKSN